MHTTENMPCCDTLQSAGKAKRFQFIDHVSKNKKGIFRCQVRLLEAHGMSLRVIAGETTTCDMQVSSLPKC